MDFLGNSCIDTSIEQEQKSKAPEVCGPQGYQEIIVDSCIGNLVYAEPSIEECITGSQDRELSRFSFHGPLLYFVCTDGILFERVAYCILFLAP